MSPIIMSSLRDFVLCRCSYLLSCLQPRRGEIIIAGNAQSIVTPKEWHKFFSFLFYLPLSFPRRMGIVKSKLYILFRLLRKLQPTLMAWQGTVGRKKFVSLCTLSQLKLIYWVVKLTIPPVTGMITFNHENICTISRLFLLFPTCSAATTGIFS